MLCLQEMCQDEWSTIRPVLAGIECIHRSDDCFLVELELRHRGCRFECHLEGECALNAFHRANDLEHVVGQLQSGEVE